MLKATEDGPPTLPARMPDAMPHPADPRCRLPAAAAGSSGSAHFETEPRVCQAAVAEREAALRAARLTYTGEQVGEWA